MRISGGSEGCKTENSRGVEQELTRTQGETAYLVRGEGMFGSRLVGRQLSLNLREGV